MKSTKLIVLWIFVAAFCLIKTDFVNAVIVSENDNQQNENIPAFAPDKVVVAFKPGTSAEAKIAAHTGAKARVIRSHAAFNADLVNVGHGKVMEKISIYQRNPNVNYAQPNYYYTLHSKPAEGYDPFVCSGYYFDEKWGLHNTGQVLMDPSTGTCSFKGSPDADIDWMEAWESGATCNNIIKIAIIDTGVECTHPDLQAECIETWIAAQIEEGPEDTIGHGTHVAGIAAASTNNGIGISGVGIGAKIGSFKVCQVVCLDSLCWFSTVICEDWDIAEAISHAVDNGYHVINMSLGGAEVSTLLQTSVQEANNAGVVVVASAGNSYKHETLSYPAAFDGVIAVAATDLYDNLASFSNFGSWVELAAPGVNILSTYLEAGCMDPDCYHWLSGTSMASPMVAGAAALIYDEYGGVRSLANRTSVIQALLNNADDVGALGQNMKAWTQNGRLNLHKSILGANSSNFPPTAGFTYTANELIVSFTDTSTDADGSVAAWSWNFGDGSTSTSQNPSKTYADDGTYTVNLTVTDNEGATGSTSKNVTVTSGSSAGITLIATGYKVKGRQMVDLSWNGATSTNVDIYRDGSLIATAPNSGSYTNDINQVGGGSYIYQVCEADTTTCSNEATVTF
jgi:thermitase